MPHAAADQGCLEVVRRGKDAADSCGFGNRLGDIGFSHGLREERVRARLWTRRAKGRLDGWVDM